VNVHTTPNHTCGLNGIGQTSVVESHNRARVDSPMRIAQVAPLYERVPPELYGGTERVVSYLTEELVGLGHDVTLFASGDSITDARLESVCPRALRLDPSPHESLALHLRMLNRVYRSAGRFDVIHCHTDYLGLPLAGFVATPTLVTLHGRLDVPDLPELYAECEHVPLVSISDAQRAPMPAANWVDTVYHGLPRHLYRPSFAPGSYLLFVGRISPEKRPDSAIAIAKAVRMPLKMAAKIDPVDRSYFEVSIRSLLGHPLIEYLGEVNDERKAELLRGAHALLFPIDWPEPFGLIMIEALACGTPVVARRCGSIPEVVRDGVTGFVCESDAQLIDALQRVSRLDRRACRAEFDARFTATAMALRYLEVYAALRAGRCEPETRSALLGTGERRPPGLPMVINVDAPRRASWQAALPARDRAPRSVVNGANVVPEQLQAPAVSGEVVQEPSSVVRLRSTLR
jgi:glycosyltransferase involved in cell wall biosynthesis